ncbi:MAG TPA: phosphoenolpyruvate carboxykinase (ATP) [Thermoguttaceae bacterium]|nr:phosphoenolpyruvate carboxykinase (ATP) [Thermoguttaceae bacterium]
MFQRFSEAAQAIFEAARREGRLIYNPSNEQLRALAMEEPGVVVSKYGSIAVESEPMSRAAMFTRNNIDTPFGEEEEKLLGTALERSAKETLVAVDVTVGDGAEGVTARLIVPKRFAHVAFAGVKLFKPAATDNPTHQVVMFFDDEYEKNRGKTLPQKSITIRNAHSNDGRLVKFARNTNYFGEWKKGVFTAEDYRAKLTGKALFLHAGCRKDTLEGADGRYRTTASLFVALSANGKTSTSCKVLARKGQERSWLIQDDGGVLGLDGTFRGFEAGGLFVKTDGLGPRDQIEAYYGSLKRETFLENVYVAPDGTIDFFNVERTSNGRAVIERRDFMHAGGEINTNRVDNIFIISRGKIIPAIAKLTHDQATAFMVLGQSMESSAGDPTQAGKIKNVFFYDPFVAGDRAAHVHLFHDILKRNPHINCYLLNTGRIGEGDAMHDIRLGDTMNILDAVLRGELTDWRRSPKTGLMVPENVPSVDPVLFHPDRVFAADVFGREQAALDRQRAEFVAKYPGLRPEIRGVFEKG